MKVAITYDKETNSVFQHFGRTEYFYIFDTESNEEQIVDNGGNSHHDLVGYLKSLGVEVLICGGLGSHAVAFLSEVNIDVIPGAYGLVDDVIKEYKEGALIADPNAMHECSHHH